ncbi:MAG: hypothetical protein Q8K98_14145 [Bacteroidota bacterium]|nr:hypothetical protein [Bacteroidota bacterium]
MNIKKSLPGIFFLISLLLLIYSDINYAQKKKSTSLEKRIDSLESVIKTLSDRILLLEARLTKLDRTSPFGSPEEMKLGLIFANRDAIINDIVNIASFGYQYRIRPKTMGGGGGNYKDFSIPTRMAENQNGSYTAIVLEDAITIQGISKLEFGTVTAIVNNEGRVEKMEFSGDFK